MPTTERTVLILKGIDALLSGGGLLVELMKRAAQTKQYAELDHAIKTKVEPFLYNKGQGKKMPVSQLVTMRNKERPRHKMVITNSLQGLIINGKLIITLRQLSVPVTPSSEFGEP